MEKLSWKPSAFRMPVSYRICSRASAVRINGRFTRGTGNRAPDPVAQQIARAWPALRATGRAGAAEKARNAVGAAGRCHGKGGIGAEDMRQLRQSGHDRALRA